ncbi:helix-turn-helix domain-containing protein [Noviherbaspirillum malthae]|uniref:helix-turn-helix domain-containing protein n=1 Tax=Noviherbaspirillum malthae TaxID=1260987 RepID=UPI00188DDC3E|nr:helix-turn-helix domain-containing protein [Noviherbaspirillum malthae]
MASSYSLDLREKILQAHARGMGSQRAIAEFFGVSLSFVEKLLQRVRRTGSAAAKKQGNGPKPRLDQLAHEQVRQLVAQKPDISLAELAEQIECLTGTHVSQATICRLLQRLGLPRKKSRSTRVNGTRPKYVRPVSSTTARSPTAPVIH